MLSQRMQSAAFAPNHFPNLQLWLDGADVATITESSGSVSQWGDKSGNAHHATQATGANQPTTGSRTLNGRNVIDFDGSNDVMILNPGVYGIATSNNTLFIVSKTDTTGLTQRILAMLTSGGLTYYQLLYSNTSGLVAFRNSSTSAALLSGITETAPNVFRGRRTGTTQELTVNSTSHTSDSNANDITAVEAVIGASSSFAGNPLDGYIAEVILYDRSLSDAEAAQVEMYLAAKWGISLA